MTKDNARTGRASGRADNGGDRDLNSTTTGVALLLDRLEKVREKGPGSWRACCPAHDDRHPSLNIDETDDGRVLIHCFVGCGGTEVITAAGLEWADLYPKRPGYRRPIPKRQRWAPRDAIHAAAHAAFVVAVAAEDLAAGRALDDADRESLYVAVGRLNAIAGKVGNG